MDLFQIYSKWSVQASKQAQIHTRVQCSHASEGLTQAHPNHNLIPHLTAVEKNWEKVWGTIVLSQTGNE